MVDLFTEQCACCLEKKMPSGSDLCGKCQKAGPGTGRRLKFFKEPPAICPQSCQDEEAYLMQASKVVINLPNSTEKTTLKDEVLKLPLAERLECVRDFGTKCLC